MNLDGLAHQLLEGFDGEMYRVGELVVDFDSIEEEASDGEQVEEDDEVDPLIEGTLGKGFPLVSLSEIGSRREFDVGGDFEDEAWHFGGLEVDERAVGAEREIGVSEFNDFGAKVFVADKLREGLIEHN